MSTLLRWLFLYPERVALAVFAIQILFWTATFVVAVHFIVKYW